MEEIIQIIIFVGAMVISVVIQNAKNKNKAEKTSTQETLEDLFPEIEIQENQEVAPQPILKPILKPIRSPQKVTPKRQAHTHIKATAAQTSANKQKKKIGISNREEAKRAFIYSEIFNRKY